MTAGHELSVGQRTSQNRDKVERRESGRLVTSLTHRGYLGSGYRGSRFHEDRRDSGLGPELLNPSTAPDIRP